MPDDQPDTDRAFVAMMDELRQRVKSLGLTFGVGRKAVALAVLDRVIGRLTTAALKTPSDTDSSDSGDGRSAA